MQFSCLPEVIKVLQNNYSTRNNQNYWWWSHWVQLINVPNEVFDSIQTKDGCMGNFNDSVAWQPDNNSRLGNFTVRTTKIYKNAMAPLVVSILRFRSLLEQNLFTSFYFVTSSAFTHFPEIFSYRKFSQISLISLNLGILSKFFYEFCEKFFLKFQQN